MTDVERVIEGRFRHPSIALLFCRHLVSTKVRALVVEAPVVFASRPMGEYAVVSAFPRGFPL